MKANEIVHALAALAQESRLAAYRLLVKRGPEGFNPGELSERLGVPAPTLSFHLKALQSAGLIVARREGRFLHYSAQFEHMQQLVEFLTENCCSESATACDANCNPVQTTVRRKRA